MDEICSIPPRRDAPGSPTKGSGAKVHRSRRSPKPRNPSRASPPDGGHHPGRRAGDPAGRCGPRASEGARPDRRLSARRVPGLAARARRRRSRDRQLRRGPGAGLRFAAEHREESGPIYAFNGDELHDVDLRAFLEAHEDHGGAATIVVAPLKSQFGVVEVAEDDRITGFREAPRLPHWVNAGIYVLDDEALERLPERGDHEQSTFPELAEEGKLFAFRHEGLWITVNTPKDLQRAEEHYAAHPELRPTLARGRR